MVRQIWIKFEKKKIRTNKFNATQMECLLTYKIISGSKHSFTNWNVWIFSEWRIIKTNLRLKSFTLFNIPTGTWVWVEQKCRELLYRWEFQTDFNWYKCNAVSEYPMQFSNMFSCVCCSRNDLMYIFIAWCKWIYINIYIPNTNFNAFVALTSNGQRHHVNGNNPIPAIDPIN